MSDPDTEIILHNYPQSPVAEKVRVALGIKGLAWRSVEIPRLPPKPLLTVLTGGYRRTPVMQIGADIYCDSQCIIHELEARFPAPTFFPTAHMGAMWGLSRWADGPLFDLSVKIVLGSAGDALPKEFAEDRGRLYFGPDWADRLQAAHTGLPHLAAQMRAPVYWLNDQLWDGRKFLMGDEPAAIDAQIYHVLWFLRGRWDDGPAFLSEFPAVEQWEANVAEIGHGDMQTMTGEEAIARAASCESTVGEAEDPRDPQGLKPGDSVRVSPDVDGGEQPVEGRVVACSCETLVVERDHEDVGRVCVHFPRAGYRAERIG